MRFLQKRKIHNDIKSGMDKTPKKLDAPPQAGGERAQRGGEMSLSDLAGYAGKAGKKAAEMGRFFASEWLREPGAQQMLIGKVKVVVKKRFLGHHQKFQKVHKIPLPPAQIQQNSSELILIC